MKVWPVALLMTGLLVGCAPRSDVPVSSTPAAKTPAKEMTDATPPPEEKKIEIADLFPAKVGNEWSYFAELNGQGVGDIVWRVVRVDRSRGGLEITIEMDSGGVIEQHHWRMTDDALLQVSGGEERTVNDPPQPLLKMPLDKGSTFDYTGKGQDINGDEGAIEAKSEILGEERIQTPAGEFMAVAVRTQSRYTSGSNTTEGTVTSWYAPQIGLVRYRMEVKEGGITTLNLNSSKLK